MRERDDMELYELRYFVAIWEAKSLSKASDIVHVSQPALSQCIRKMEGELRTRLFQRPLQNMKLTEVGEIVYEYGKNILGLMQNMDGAISEVLHSDDVEIAVGMSPFYSKFYLPSIIPYIRKQFPNIRIRIVEDISSNLEAMLFEGQLDFCCVPSEPEQKGITYETICIEEILLAIPPDNPINQYAIPANPVPYMDLKHVEGQKFVSLKPVQKINSMLDPLLDSIGLKHNEIYQTLNWDTVDIMIANGIGVGFIPDILCMKDKTSPSPCYYRIPNRRFLRHYSIAYKDDKSFTPLEHALTLVFKNRIAEFRKSHIVLGSCEESMS